jgi:hypothetical protein
MAARLRLHLPHSLPRDSPAPGELLQRLRRIVPQPVVDDVPADRADALPDLPQRAADPKITHRRCVGLLRRRALVLQALEIRRPVVASVDGNVQRDVRLRHRARPHPNRRARFPEIPPDEGADPPGGVRREASPDPRVELLDRAHQADIALLDDVLEAHRAAVLLARHGHDERQIVASHLLLRGDVSLAGMRCQEAFLGARQDGELPDRLEIAVEGVECAISARVDSSSEAPRNRERAPTQACAADETDQGRAAGSPDPLRCSDAWLPIAPDGREPALEVTRSGPVAAAVFLP